MLLLRSRPYVSHFGRASDGVRVGQWDLSIARLREIPILEPPFEEQVAIVRYLAHANRRIDQAIAAKRKLIRLLEEQKQVIINRAVTCGFDASVPMKDSQIPWVGQVPAHWKVTRLKAVVKSLDSKRVPLSSLERGTMTVREFDYYGASGVIDKVDEYLFDSPSILLAEDGANLVLRNLPLAIIARGKYWVNNHAHVLRPIEGSLEFLAHALERIDYRPWITGAAQPKLTQDRLMAVQIALPGAAEQHEIAARLSDETAESDAVIRRARLEIDLLREFRTRLTADVVTGRVDVREISASLPDISLDELGESVDGSLDDELDELAEEFVEDAALV